MVLRQEKINEIKNLNLIYVYTTDSIFKNDTDKYVGIKVVYNNNYIIDGKYSDNNFELLIKRVIDRYNKEKDVRNIILLGNLTKDLVNSASFHVLENSTELNNQIPYYNSEDKEIMRYKNYLLEAFNIIMKKILMFENIENINLRGINRKYKIDYTLAGKKSSVDLIIYKDENTLYFKLNQIEGKRHLVEGTIEEKLGSIITDINVDDFYLNLVYDAYNNEIIKHIDYKDETYYHEDSIDTILSSELDTLNYYLSIAGINEIDNIIKVNDNTYIGCVYKEKNENDELLYDCTNILISIDKDRVSLTKIKYEGFSKYQGEIKVLLDKDFTETILRKYNMQDKNSIIIETNNNNSYKYEIINIEDDIDLTNPFNKENSREIEIESIEDIKKFILKGNE